MERRVYRLAQESLTNALRHAHNAARVEIRGGRRREHGCELRVTDDGQCRPGAPASRGFGLLGMRERVAAARRLAHAGPAPEGGWAVRRRAAAEEAP